MEDRSPLSLYLSIYLSDCYVFMVLSYPVLSSYATQKLFFFLVDSPFYTIICSYDIYLILYFCPVYAILYIFYSNSNLFFFVSFLGSGYGLSSGSVAQGIPLSTTCKTLIRRLEFPFSKVKRMSLLH